MVEQEAVNFEVAGSSPAAGAKPSTQRGRPSPMTGLFVLFTSVNIASKRPRPCYIMAPQRFELRSRFKTVRNLVTTVILVRVQDL